MGIGLEGAIKKAGQRVKTISEVFYPQIDISEDGEDVHIYLDLPGFEKKNIQILGTKRGVKVSGQREKGLSGRIIYEERVEEFSKFIRIATDFDPDSIKAKLKDGVLEIQLKRKEVKTVPIN